MKKIKSIKDLEKWKDEILARQQQYETVITVCGGTGCQAYHCQEVKKAFQKELAKEKMGERVSLKYTGCPGFCERGPLVTILP